MAATSPVIMCPPRFHERRHDRRAPMDGSARLVVRGVGGFVLDVSDMGMRVAVWETSALEGSKVLLWVEGDPKLRPGVVKWARRFPDGSIVGIEFITEVPRSAQRS